MEQRECEKLDVAEKLTNLSLIKEDKLDIPAEQTNVAEGDKPLLNFEAEQTNMAEGGKSLLNFEEKQMDLSAENMTRDKLSFVERELRIVILGKTGNGKSALGNMIVGEKVFISESSMRSVTRQCEEKMFRYLEKPIQVVDTPGFLDTEMTPENLKEELEKCIGITSPGPNVVLLVIRVGRFTDEDTLVLETFQEWLGHEIIKHVIVVFTGLDDLAYDEKTVPQYIASVPSSLKELLQKCGNRYIFVNARCKGEERQHCLSELYNTIESVRKQNKGMYYTSEMYQKVEEEMKNIEGMLVQKLKEKEEAGHRKKLLELEKHFKNEKGETMTDLEMNESLKELIQQEDESFFISLHQRARQDMRRAILLGALRKYICIQSCALAGGIVGAALGPVGIVIGSFLGTVIGFGVNKIIEKSQSSG